MDRYLDQLLDAGLDAINVSLDTVDPVLYEKITGRDKLADVMRFIEKAESLPIPVKINAVSIDFRQLQENGKLQNFPSESLAADGRTCKALSGGCAFYRNDAHRLWKAV